MNDADLRAMQTVAALRAQPFVIVDPTILLVAIRQEIEAAVAAEQEACAKEAIFKRDLCMGYAKEEMDLVERVCRRIEKNIRARGTT